MVLPAMRTPWIFALSLGAAGLLCGSARADEVVVYERPPSGTALLATGAALTGVGVLNMTAGTALCFALFPSSPSTTPFALYNPDSRSICIDTSLIVGGVLTAAGLPLLITGASRYGRYKEWKQQHPELTWTAVPLRGGGAAGLTLSF
jgi:hypothetical protein